MTNKEIWQIAMEQSANDLNCNASYFLEIENCIVISKANDLSRKYLELPFICNLVSYGTNVVVTGREDLLPLIEQCIDRMPAIENCFETPGMYPLNRILETAGARICFMADYFLPDIDEVLRYERLCAGTFEFRVMESTEFAGLYLPEWKNALCADHKHLDRLAVGAFDRGQLVGLAGCSADCDTMWQIGVDVLPAYRRAGIASALTNRLARETFERELVPFYCAAWSNVKSVRNAIRSGFRPGWVEATAKADGYIEDMLKKGR